MKRNVGALVAVVLTLVGLTAVVFAFMSNASPYVTVAEAKARPSNNQHLSGDIVPGSVNIDYRGSKAQFQLKDAEGQLMSVTYSGSIPSNMTTATKVVAVGGYKNGVFESEKLMLKCPSKYESGGAK
jgi:cytochrome c-type biogenesis protein CcmE